MSKTLTYVVSHYLLQLQCLLLIDLKPDFLGVISFSLCKTFIKQFFHPSTQELKWQDISCTDPQVHLQTRSHVHLEHTWAPEVSKGDGAEAAFKFSSPRVPNPCALLPAIWVSLALNCFGGAAKRPALLLRNDAAWRPNMHDHTAEGRPHDMPPCRTARQNDPSRSQQCHNAVSNHSQRGSIPLLPTGLWRKTGPGLGRLHSAACSQHGGTSYRRMPHMPIHTAPMVWVTAMWVKRG